MNWVTHIIKFSLSSLNQKKKFFCWIKANFTILIISLTISSNFRLSLTRLTFTISFKLRQFAKEQLNYLTKNKIKIEFKKKNIVKVSR